MKRRLLARSALLAFFTLTLLHMSGAAAPRMKMTTDIPASITTRDRVKTSIGTLEFFDGVPTKDTVQTLYDYIDRARAVEVFLNLIPSMSMYALREGQRSTGCSESHEICIFETLMDSRSLVLTGNTSTMYALGFLDLAKDGPTVVDLPTGMLGALNDMAFRYMEDLGIAGPDEGNGGEYLVLPPGHEGEVPEGYFPVPSKTYGVWLFLRGYLAEGIEAAAKNIKNNLEVYPLARAASRPQMKFVNVSGKEGLNTVLPNDFSFYENLHALVQEEPADFLDPETMGLIASIGIVKGKPFAPDARMRKILSDGVAIGNATARAITFHPRDPGQRIYADTDSGWLMGYADKNVFFLRDDARNLDARVWFHYNAIVVTPAMAVTVPGKGSDYALGGLDSKRRPLDGSRTYKLHLPPNIPVKDFWAVTLYDTQTRSQLQTDQQFPTLDSYREGLQKNADGSIDLYFGPEPLEGHESNWLQTVPGKSWFPALRLYGPLQPWIDQTWRPGEIERVE